MRGRTSHFISVSHSLGLCVCVTGPLCFLLMNSLVSVLKRPARVLSRLRAAIRSLMALLTNIWAWRHRRRLRFGFSIAV